MNLGAIGSRRERRGCFTLPARSRASNAQLRADARCWSRSRQPRRRFITHGAVAAGSNALLAAPATRPGGGLNELFLLIAWPKWPRANASASFGSAGAFLLVAPRAAAIFSRGRRGDHDGVRALVAPDQRLQDSHRVRALVVERSPKRVAVACVEATRSEGAFGGFHCSAPAHEDGPSARTISSRPGLVSRRGSRAAGLGMHGSRATPAGRRRVDRNRLLSPRSHRTIRTRRQSLLIASGAP